MATYYVCSSTGSDANNGLGPDASAVTNKPWATIQKCLGAAGIASGDTVYVGPGTYREVVTVAMTSAVAETSVLGDPGNAQGFKTSGGVLVGAAEVIWTAYLTNDTTAPSASNTLNVAGRDYLTFRYLTFVAGTSTPILMTTQTSTNITFNQCIIYQIGLGVNIDYTIAFGVVANLTITSCIFSSQRGGYGIRITGVSGTGADWDISATVTNCLFSGNGAAFYGVLLTGSGGGANLAGGGVVKNCTFAGFGGVFTGGTRSNSIPGRAYNNCIVNGNTGIFGFEAIVLNDLIENYNYVSSQTTHTNVTQGANTVVNSNRAPNWSYGEERLYGWTPRMFMEPKTGSWMLTFGNDGTYTTSEDLLGLPRPGGGASATKGIGYLGRGNTFTKETGTVRTGSNAISITGPGTQDFQLPVDATSTKATVYVRWDATYAGTKPLMKVLNGGECGVTDATATATGASGAWEAISLNFTPARVGIVTIRLQSSDTNGAGVMFADDFSVV